MTIGFDTYSLVARILPGYIVIAPITLLLIFAPADGQISFGGAALLIPIIYFFSYQVGRDRGKRIEPRLWEKWGGAPVTRFLRHSNTEFNNDNRLMVHNFMRTIGHAVPSPEDERQNPESADYAYDMCGRTVIRKTRETEKFPLVFRSLITYGFQRNLYGLKPFGVTVNLLSLAACVAMIAVIQLGVTDAVILPTSTVPSASVATAANVGLLLLWLIKVREQTVKRAADEYAYFLLEAALTLNESMETTGDRMPKLAHG